MDKYQLAMGSITTLSAKPLPAEILRLAPKGARQAAWLAGRVLLSQMLPTYNQFEEKISGQGKPYLLGDNAPWFNLSHSGDYVFCALSRNREIGCDIEVIRPKENWKEMAEEYFTEIEYEEILRLDSRQQIFRFWLIWTAKEARIKKDAGSVWQMGSLPYPESLRHSVILQKRVALSVCL